MAVEKLARAAPRLLPIPRTVLYLAVLAAATLFYSWHLGQTPVHLHHDELEYALNGHSIARSLRDTNGTLLPFYLIPPSHMLATPIITYTTALYQTIFPVSEWAVRLPSVSTGLLSIFLIMLLIQSTFKNRWITFIAGLLATTTPMLFILSRLLLDNLYPIPFILLWLVLLKRFLDHKKIAILFLAGLSLGVGIHSYHSPKLYMPIYFIATTIALIPEIKKSARVYIALIAGFTIPILIFLPWLARHPEITGQLVGYVASHDPTTDVSKGVFGVLAPGRVMKALSSSYLAYFDPRILFISGDRHPVLSTQQIGAFLIPIFFLATIGSLVALIRPPDRIAKVVLFGFLTYPLAPAFMTEPQRISRGSVVIPFLIILAAYGAEYLLRSKDRIFKSLLVALLIGSLLQFSFFLKDYHGPYRARSYGWFNNNIGGALEAALSAMQTLQANALYLDQRMPWVDRYSLFYQLKLGIHNPPPQSLFNPQTMTADQLAPRSIVVTQAANTFGTQNTGNTLRLLHAIKEPDDTISFYVYYRTP